MCVIDTEFSIRRLSWGCRRGAEGFAGDRVQKRPLRLCRPGKMGAPGASTLTFITSLYILPAASAKLKGTCEKPSGRQKKLQGTWKKLQSTWKKLSGRQCPPLRALYSAHWDKRKPRKPRFGGNSSVLLMQIYNIFGRKANRSNYVLTFRPRRPFILVIIAVR